MILTRNLCFESLLFTADSRDRGYNLPADNNVIICEEEINNDNLLREEH